MITNNSGIKKIHIGFDLKPLISALEKAPDDFLLQKDWKDDVPISAKTKKIITNNVLLIRDVADKFGKMGVKYKYK